MGFWYTNREAVAGARKVLLMTHIAGYGLLAAILLIYFRTGSALWTNPAVANAFTGSIFVLMLVELIAKSVQFPLHTWIPEAMAAPPRSAPCSTPPATSKPEFIWQPACTALAHGPLPGRNVGLGWYGNHGRRRDVRHGAD